MSVIEFKPLYPDEDEAAILARFRAWANEGLDPAVDSDRWVDTREGSHWFVGVMPAVREFARVYDFMGTEVVAAGFPVWAWGDYLDDHAEVHDIERLAATKASGIARFIGAPGTVIAAGTTVTAEPPTEDADVAEYEVTEGGTLPDPITTPDDLAATPAGTGGTLAAGDRDYAITAFDLAGETQRLTPDGEASATVVSGGSTGTVTLSWSAVPGALGYRVYFDSGSGFRLLAEVATPGYVDTGADEPDEARVIPVANTTGGELLLPIRATEAGSFGDVGAGAVTVLSTPLPGVEVTNDEEITGGTDAETDDALRERVLDSFQGNGPGNKKDYERRARAWEGVGRVTVIPQWDGPGTVKVIVTDAAGQPLSAEIVDGLQADMDPVPGLGEGWAPISAVVTVTTATVLNVSVGADVELEPGFSLDGAGGTVDVSADIEDALRDYIERVEPGGEIVIAQVMGRIATVFGVHDVDNVEVNGSSTNVAVDSDPPKVPHLAAVDLTAADV